MPDLLVWVDLSPDHHIAQARGRGAYEARRYEPDQPDRWTLSGPQDRQPWSVGTFAEVTDAAAFIEQRRAERPTRQRR